MKYKAIRETVLQTLPVLLIPFVKKYFEALNECYKNQQIKVSFK